MNDSNTVLAVVFIGLDSWYKKGDISIQRYIE